MGRAKRVATGGFVFHVLNRANGRLPIFENDGDYQAFENILAEAQVREQMRILAWCLMPNHWHLVLWPREDGDLTRFTGWLTLTHTQRWHAHRGTAGTGHLYQGRFKSFPVEGDDHFLTVCRYAERNALRAKLVNRAEYWRWSSLAAFIDGGPRSALLAPWPVRRSLDWVDHVNAPQSEAEETALRRAIRRGSPFGGEGWVEHTARLLGLESTLVPRGRPRKLDAAGEKGS